ncbi:peptidylprolyl isomerase [Aeoliella sp. ICT_H6.2]|uniref:peptidylprolyl isomerase n=1 Tax=Aeoliella straminimaris TaxID=2954799 RepID=A0A9X2JH15_9BACT|nr:peptidylprolyl isomerase [Aeoliella straminimaris]MCO6045580.1 peptidylprolyl isomerase [Aeoliella straminimaris]
MSCQHLEDRWLMAVDVMGDEMLVNDLVFRSQSTEAAEAAVAVSEFAQVVVFSGNGPGDDSGVFAKLYDADGEVQGDGAFLVNSTVRGDQYAASVAMDADGNFVVVWAGRGVVDDQGIFLQRFDSSGTALGEETLVNSTTAGKQIDPTIAMDADGAFVVGWSGQSTSDATGVYLQRFTAAGEQDGDEVLVNSTTYNRQEGLAMVFDAAGNLVTAWSSLGQDTSDWGVYGQRFDADGDRLGEEFLWNTTTTGSQTGVVLAAGTDGEVVAAWQTYGQDGDGWGVAARMLDADGTTLADEILLNDVTDGEQFDVKLGIAEDGTWIAAWTTVAADGAGYEVAARAFEGDGSPEGDSFAVNQDTSGANSGHQHHASIAIWGDLATIVWSGKGAADRQGVYRQDYEVDLIDDGPQEAPDLAEISDTVVEVGMEMEITITATDANSRDDLTFFLDGDNSPAGATIEQTDNNTAIIRWTPTDDFEGEDVLFRVLVTDDGDPALVDSEEFTVTVGNIELEVDLNGEVVSDDDVTATFAPSAGPTSIVPEELVVIGANEGMVSGATVILDAAPDGDAEVLAVDVGSTAITASYDAATRTLTLTGTDTVSNYEQVLRTLTYDNTEVDATGTRTITVTVTDALETSSEATIELTIGSADLVGLAQAIAGSGAIFYGAGWCPNCTAQKEMFEDGSQLLPFIEVTNPDRTLNGVGTDNDISVLPTWEFSDGTRIEGVTSLQVLAAAAGVAIPTSDTPYMAEIEDDTLLVGSPLHIPLDGYDPNGEPLTYEVSTDNAGVTATLLTDNRSMRIAVEGYGDMVFELFEDRASRATDRVIELADDDFYDDVIFHRVVNGFVIQGGDPTGTGSGGSTLGDFDDQFNVDLQHNRRGLLSFAKSGDDTNDSQFFITETATRSLDFNHTIFGIMVEGEANREAISNTAVEKQELTPEISSPVNDVVMRDVEIFTDTENAVLMLKADEGVSGPVEITVTVTNSAGNSFERKFTVNVEDDTFDNRPFLDDIAPVSIEAGTSAQIQLSSQDVDGGPIIYQAFESGSVDYTFDLTDEGLLTVTPPDGFTGTMEIEVRVTRNASSQTDFDAQLVVIEVTDPMSQA